MTRSLYLVVAFALTLTACKDHRNLAPPLARAVPASVGVPNASAVARATTSPDAGVEAINTGVVPTSSEGATTATVQGDSPASLATSRDIDDLPIHLGDDWQTTKNKLRSLDSQCEVRQLTAIEMVICLHIPLSFGFMTARGVAAKTMGGLRVEEVEILGIDSYGDCLRMKDALSALRSAWKVTKSTETDGPQKTVDLLASKVTDGEDLTLHAHCAPPDVAPTKIWLFDAWVNVDTGMQGFLGRPLSAGLLVREKITSSVSAGQALQLPLYERAIMDCYKDSGAGFENAVRNSTRLSKRSKMAFAQYLERATNPEWFWGEYKSEWVRQLRRQ